MITREELLTPGVIAALNAHARQAYPDECIGVIVNGVYQPETNVAERPDISCQIASARMLELRLTGGLQAICHSHPNGPNCPSSSDMAFQIENALPFVLVSTNGEGCLPPVAWGDQLEPPPLMTRGFIHGVTDCFAFGRDYYRMKQGVYVPDFPRSWRWWEQGATLYESKYQEAGFIKIDREEAQPGDTVLFRVKNSPTANHAGIIIEPGLIAHHPGRLIANDPSLMPREDVLNRWLHFTYADGWLRKAP